MDYDLPPEQEVLIKNEENILKQQIEKKQINITSNDSFALGGEPHWPDWRQQYSSDDLKLIHQFNLDFHRAFVISF